MQYFVSYSDGAALFTSRLYNSARRPFIMYNEVAMMITVSVATVEECVVLWPTRRNVFCCVIMGCDVIIQRRTWRYTCDLFFFYRVRVNLLSKAYRLGCNCSIVVVGLDY